MQLQNSMFAKGLGSVLKTNCANELNKKKTSLDNFFKKLSDILGHLLPFFRLLGGGSVISMFVLANPPELVCNFFVGTLSIGLKSNLEISFNTRGRPLTCYILYWSKIYSWVKIQRYLDADSQSHLTEGSSVCRNAEIYTSS